MQLSKRVIAGLFALFAACGFGTTVSAATLVAHMDLPDLVGNADRIYRGTVLSKEPGSVTAGGGELPTVVYRIRVDDALKGDFGDGKEAGVMTISMVGSLKQPEQDGDVQRAFFLDMNPNLEVGRAYVLFTTPPSAVGLSTTVGLNQGLFRVFNSADGSEMASNGAGNQGLFDGPVSYAELKSAITAEMN